MDMLYVNDDAYDATGWNGSTNVPTKNAIRDKIESLSLSGGSATNVFGIDIDSFSTNGTPTCIWTGTVSTATSSRVQVQVTGAGPTNSASYNLDALFRRGSGNVSKTATNNVSTLESDAGMFAYLAEDTTDQAAKLYVGGLTNEQFHWLAKGWQWSLTNHAVVGTTYLLSQDAEDAGDATPTGWTDSGGDVNWGYATSPAPLDGTESVSVASAAYQSVATFTAQSDVWAYAHFATDGTTGSPYVVQLLDSGNNVVAGALLILPGTVRSYVGTSNGSGSFTVSANTKYSIWLHYTKGTGANALCEVYLSADDTKPGTYTARITTGAATTDAEKIRIRTDYGTTRMTLDKIRVSASTIGSNPD